MRFMFYVIVFTSDKSLVNSLSSPSVFIWWSLKLGSLDSQFTSSLGEIFCSPAHSYLQNKIN